MNLKNHSGTLAPAISCSIMREVTLFLMPRKMPLLFLVAMMSHKMPLLFLMVMMSHKMPLLFHLWVEKMTPPFQMDKIRLILIS